MGSINRIDFMGSSGVGKSTLYNELLKRRDKNEKWVTSSELRIKIARMRSKQYTHSIGSRIRSLILNSQALKVIHPQLIETILSKHEYKYLVLWESQEEVEAINNMIRAIASIQFPPIFKLHRYRQVFKFAQQVALFQTHAPENTTVVIDNSLSNEVQFLGPWMSDDDIQSLYSYFPALGKISGIVFVDADDRIILERLEKRMGLFVNIAHRGMTYHEVANDIRRRLESARQVADMLEKKGVPVVRVNSGDLLDKQVEIVNNFLKQYFLTG